MRVLFLLSAFLFLVAGCDTKGIPPDVKLDEGWIESQVEKPFVEPPKEPEPTWERFKKRWKDLFLLDEGMQFQNEVESVIGGDEKVEKELAAQFVEIADRCRNEGKNDEEIIKELMKVVNDFKKRLLVKGLEMPTKPLERMSLEEMKSWVGGKFMNYLAETLHNLQKVGGKEDITEQIRALMENIQAATSVLTPFSNKDVKEHPHIESEARKFGQSLNQLYKHLKENDVNAAMGEFNSLQALWQNWSLKRLREPTEEGW